MCCVRLGFSHSVAGRPQRGTRRGLRLENHSRRFGVEGKEMRASQPRGVLVLTTVVTFFSDKVGQFIGASDESTATLPAMTTRGNLVAAFVMTNLSFFVDLQDVCIL
ncbi:unnamed protein product [Ectocarpus sp. 8 AP-2014]